MDFEPILNPETPNNTTIVPSDTEIVTEQPKREVLSMMSLLKVTEGHIIDGAKCRKERQEVGDILSLNRDMLSPKELVEYFKVLLKAEEYHSDCIFKAYTIMAKQAESKEIWVGSKKEVLKNVTEKKKINTLVSMLRNPQNFQKA